MTEFYEYTPAINANGDFEIDPDTDDLKAGHPMAEVVKIIIATDQGSYAPDSTVGVKSPTKDVINAGADLQTSIQQQLKPYIRNKLIKDVQITTESQDNAIASETSFVDPNDKKRVVTKKRFNFNS